MLLVFRESQFYCDNVTDFGIILIRHGGFVAGKSEGIGCSVEDVQLLNRYRVGIFPVFDRTYSRVLALNRFYAKESDIIKVPIA